MGSLRAEFVDLVTFSKASIQVACLAVKLIDVLRAKRLQAEHFAASFYIAWKFHGDGTCYCATDFAEAFLPRCGTFASSSPVLRRSERQLMQMLQWSVPAFTFADRLPGVFGVYRQFLLRSSHTALVCIDQSESVSDIAWAVVYHASYLSAGQWDALAVRMQPCDCPSRMLALLRVLFKAVSF